MNCKMFSEEGLKLTRQVYYAQNPADPRIAEIDEALTYFDLADKLMAETKHVFVCRDAKLCDLLAEMKDFLEGEEKQMAWEGLKAMGNKVAWVGQQSAKQAGRAFGALGRTIKKGLSRPAVSKDRHLRELELEIQLTQLQLDLEKAKQK